ncbi:AraC family transcriptional regulator [Caulobacter sp. BP25]|uniref:helix-turn-helix domain-containing protein n=1 Tax=Caulobacter sp. BP25 TaxID=2048900 RepID=UPI000C12C4AD|nr:AraC family transcriptional regulator [Caulobacter sp. BP25]PHY18390.1 AraC family transcriptional regulator [Caulobacter sp. BP25]
MRVEVQTAMGRPGRRWPETYLYGGLFAAAITAFCLARLLGQRLGPASDLMAIAGDATCGWSWLLVRALFQPPRSQRAVWPLILVLTLVAIGAALRASVDLATPLSRMALNLGGLISSAMLVMATLEPLKGLSPRTPRSERRFRLAFTTGYGALLVVAVLWANGAPPAPWTPAIKPVCALAALVGMGAAIAYRRRHPLEPARAARQAPLPANAEDLAQAIRRLMADEALYAQPNLRVADLARRLGEPEYKITQCVTGPLGFPNFSQMTNYFRIEEAKRRLSDPACDHLPILTLSYDCGFGSIGPFNRAFKAQTGMTPQALRKGHRRTA